MLNSTPAPNPNMPPMLICFTADGLRLPSLNTGTSFLLPPSGAELESPALSSGAGEESLSVGRDGARKGRERPSVMTTDRAVTGRRNSGRVRVMVAEDSGLLRKADVLVVKDELRREGRRGDAARKRSMSSGAVLSDVVGLVCS